MSVETLESALMKIRSIPHDTTGELSDDCAACIAIDALGSHVKVPNLERLLNDLRATLEVGTYMGLTPGQCRVLLDMLPKTFTQGKVQHGG